MKKIILLCLIASFLVSCGGDGGTSSTNTNTVDGALSTVSDGVKSAGEGMNSSSLMALRYPSSANKSTETQSSSLTYCTQFGNAWDATNSSVADANDTNYAIHQIECAARIAESTETPLGFLSQIEFIVCILTDAGVDFNTAGTYSNISVVPANGSATCKAKTQGSIKNETDTYTFNVTIADNPTGWDKSATLTVGGNPFYKIFASFGTDALAIKAIEYDSGTAKTSFDVHVNQGQGALLFESMSYKDNTEGHVRLLVEGTIGGDYKFSSVSNVEGIKVIGSDETNTNSWSGATLKGNPSGSIFYEALQVSNGTNALCASGCTASTGSSCGSSQCVNFGTPNASPFVDESAFATPIADETSGPICFASVTNATAPTRSTLSTCTIN